KVAVEPGEGERAAVDLHAELEVALVRHVRAGLDPQVGRVGMRPQHAETRLRRGLFSSAEGQQRSAAAKEIAAAGLDAPPLALGELRKSGLPQAARRLLHAVMRRGAGLDVVEEI